MSSGSMEESLTVAFLKIIAGVFAASVVAVVGWFCKEVTKAQRETEKDLAATRLDVSENYQKKKDAETVRLEHKSEIARLHDRLDMVFEKLETVPQKTADILKGHL